MKDSGVNAIESLMERRGAFDYILLETTGLADPGNIAPLFWVDEGLGSTIYLDGIVTLVDGKNILRSLDAPAGEEAVQHADDEHGHHSGPVLSTAHLQISHADIVIINKADLITEAELGAVQERVRSINALARIQVTDHSQVAQLEGLVLDLHAYDNVSAENLEFASKGHSHLDPAIGTITLVLPVLDTRGVAELDKWLRTVLWETNLPHANLSGWDIHRIKGRIPLQDGGLKVLQGVREIFELIDGIVVDESSDDAKGGKIVIIGRNIGHEAAKIAFQESLSTAVADR